MNWQCLQSLLSERIFQTMCDIFTLCADFHWTGFSDLVLFVIFVTLVQDFSTRGIVCMMCVNIHLIIYEDWYWNITDWQCCSLHICCNRDIVTLLGVFVVVFSINFMIHHLSCWQMWKLQAHISGQSFKLLSFNVDGVTLLGALPTFLPLPHLISYDLFFCLEKVYETYSKLYLGYQNIFCNFNLETRFFFKALAF